MPYWKPLFVDGVAVDLTHLETFEFEVLPVGASAPATVRVVFNNHCFSAEFDGAVHPARLPDTHVAGRESRAGPACPGTWAEMDTDYDSKASIKFLRVQKDADFR